MPAPFKQELGLGPYSTKHLGVRYGKFLLKHPGVYLRQIFCKATQTELQRSIHQLAGTWEGAVNATGSQDSKVSFCSGFRM